MTLSISWFNCGSVGVVDDIGAPWWVGLVDGSEAGLRLKSRESFIKNLKRIYQQFVGDY